MERKREHLHILAERALIEQIDDWQFGNRIRSRGETLRRLIQIGLKNAPQPAATGDAHQVAAE